ncbi:hypothetical protein WJX79_005239 [Trebouxia sp. C0005]
MATPSEQRLWTVFSPSKNKPAANSVAGSIPQTSSEPDKASDKGHQTAESASNVSCANGKDAGAASQKPDKTIPAPQQQATVQATGSAALLARIRQQRIASSKGNSAAAAPAANGAAPKQAQEVVVAYASQTGTAQEIARNIQAESSKHGIQSKVLSFNELGMDSLMKPHKQVVVMVVSSTGEGDPPDNSARFYGHSKRRSLSQDALRHINFTCLGLGDSNYTRYMGVPRAFKGRFGELGAKVFYPHLEADEVDGLEEFVDKWIAGLWGPLKATALGMTQSDASADAASAEAAIHGNAALSQAAGTASNPPDLAHPSAAEAEYRDREGMYSPEQPFWAVVSNACALTSTDSDRQVLHVEFDVEGSGMQYKPGDSVGLLPHNSPHLVQGLLQHLGQNGSQVFSVVSSSGDDTKLLQHLGWPCTLEHALMCGCDLTSIPRKSLLRLLGEHCSSQEDKQRLLHLSSIAGRQDYNTDIKAAQPSLLDLFHQFPSCQPPLAALLDCLPPLAPRMYSVSCSPLERPHAVQVAFSVVRYATPAGVRHGLATNWLQQLCKPVIDGRVTAAEARVRLPLYLRQGGSFGPPTKADSGLPDLAAPMLMIGPGTGVAPFRGFLQQRQHQIAGHKESIGSLSTSDATAFLAAMTKQQRYVRDIWS